MKNLFASFTVLGFLFLLSGASTYVPDQAEDIQTDTTNFDNNLSSADTTVQAALETLDEITGGAGSGDISAVGSCSTGNCFIDGTNQTLTFEGSSSDTIESSLGATNPTSGDQTFNLPDMASSGTYTLATTQSNVSSATALASNPTNCSAGNYPLGIDANGNVESCTAVSSGDSITVNSSAASDANFLDGDIDFTLVGASNPDDITATVACTGCIDATDMAADSVGESELIESMNFVSTGGWDHGGGTLEVPNSTSLPGTCTVGQVYMDTDATTGQRIYACESANTWALQGDGGGAGGGAPTTVDYLVGTADGTLSGEIVVGTSPGGELGGTWASPTLDDSVSVASWTISTPTLDGTNVNIGGGASATELRFLEPSGSGSNYTGFKSPALAGNVVYTLPTADGTAGQILKTDGSAALSWTDNTISLTFVIDGGGSTLATGVSGDLEVPFAGTIQQVTMLADQSGSTVVDIWKDTYANYPPTDADSITASAVPTISSATKSQDSTLTGWTTSITAGDILRFNVDSATTITRVTISLKIKKS